MPFKTTFKIYRYIDIDIFKLSEVVISNDAQHFKVKKN